MKFNQSQLASVFKIDRGTVRNRLKVAQLYDKNIKHYELSYEVAAALLDIKLHDDTEQNEKLEGFETAFDLNQYHLAQKTKLQNQILQGELVDVDEMQDQIAFLLAKLQSFGDVVVRHVERIVSDVTHVQALERAIQEEVKTIFNEICDETKSISE